MPRQRPACSDVFGRRGRTTTLASSQRRVRFGCASSWRSSQSSAEFCASIATSQSGTQRSSRIHRICGALCSQKRNGSLAAPPPGATAGGGSSGASVAADGAAAAYSVPARWQKSSVRSLQLSSIARSPTARQLPAGRCTVRRSKTEKVPVALSATTTLAAVSSGDRRT